MSDVNATTPAVGQISPDGQMMWNGQAWGPNPHLPKKKKTLRNVLIIVAVLFVLMIGGCMALIGGAANEVGKEIDKSIKESERKDALPGGPNNPLTIVEGKAFEVQGFKYAPGWKVANSLDSPEITGLKVTNERKKSDSALVEIKFWKGTEVLALVDCTTEPIDVGTTVTLGCLSGDPMPAGYDKITINDSF